MQAFRATGTFPNGRVVQAFTKDVVAADEVDARHRVYSFFGSRHGTNRRFVKIESVTEIEPTQSTEAAVISAFRDTHDFSSAAAAEGRGQQGYQLHGDGLCQHSADGSVRNAEGSFGTEATTQRGRRASR